MAEDLMRYDLMAQDALRGVVKAALKRAARTGLPGDHHFFIAFDTNHSGVKISERLRKKYPEEMTIVLQHQFWSLQVSEDKFEVDLSFDNIPERLSVPFVAIKGFFDPSVQFGLQFEVMQASEIADQPADSTSQGGPPAPIAILPSGAEATAGDAGNRPRSRKGKAGSAGAVHALSDPASQQADNSATKRAGSSSGKSGPELPDAAGEKAGDTAGAAKVVQLDTFRKK